MAQVKFYSVSTAPTSQTANEGGVYFVNGGELYKGSTRFGLGRVTVDANFVPSTSTLDGQARGDIVVTGGGDGWVFDGSSWQSIGGNIAAITSSWRADISSYIAGLATGGSTSVITTITQSTDGTVSATAVSMPFATLYDVAEGWQSLNDLVGSISSSVSDLESRVADIEEIVDASSSTVTANAITATDLSASNFTLGMQTVTDIVTAIGPSSGGGAATDQQLVTALAVAKKFATLDNAMHFLGVGTVTRNAQTGAITVTPPANTTPAKGDIVIDSTSGLEAVCTSVTAGDTPTYTWELIGDNALYALNAYSNANISAYAGVTTVPAALDAAGDAIDTLTASASTFASTKAQIGSSTTDNFYGMTATIELKSNADPTIVFTNGTAGADIVTTSTAITASATRLVTANAVCDFVTAKISAADWASTSNSSANGVTVTASVDTSASTGKIQIGLEIVSASTAADVSDSTKADNLVTAAAVSAYTVQEITSAISGLDATVSASDKGVFVQIDEADGVLTGATVTVAAVSEMTFGATGSEDQLATTAAVKTFFDNNLVWLDASGSAITTA